MNGDISIDLGGVFPYVEQRLLGLFGKDEQTQTWKLKLKNLARISTEQASHIQTVGMHTPVPIQKIYQPARLRKKGDLGEEHYLPVEELITRQEDAVIFAGPGYGKTTLLHHLFISHLKNERIVCVLFTLRRSNVTNDLVEFVDHLASQRDKSQRILFLVDGFDEITEDEQHMVAKALMLFKSLKRGQFSSPVEPCIRSPI